MESLHEQKLVTGTIGPSTLKYVDVQEIRDNTIILRDGSLREILAVSSINFDLKSSDEQEAVIAGYQQFLNSLDFPSQFVISSRRFNITPYLDILKTKEAEQTNDLLRLQISEYRNFIKELTDVTNIMTKNFYVVIPFFPVEQDKRGVFSTLFSKLNPEKVVSYKYELFETYKSQIKQRIDHVSAGLSRIGVHVVPLNTQEIIELLYNSYNPNLFSINIVKNIELLETQLQ